MEHNEAKQHRRRPWLAWACVAVGVGVAGYGLWGLLGWWHTTHSPATGTAKTLSKLVTQSTGSPDETAVAKTTAYTVPANVPRSLSLPSIKAESFIQQVSVDQHNAVAVPGNVHVAGWFIHSVRPGDTGLSIIDGHVQGKYTDGIFKHLAQLKKGDTFQVEFGDHSHKTFAVRSVDSYTVAEATKRLFEAAPDINRQLTLITCGGSYSKTTGEYDRRVIVVAEFVP